MPRIKIKQLGERRATGGVHLGGGPERRKLEPGEIVDIPEDVLHDDGVSIFDTVYATGAVEITTEAPTRPLDYKNAREGKLCSPTFITRGDDDEREVENALAAVAERMANEAEAPEKASPAKAKKAASSARRKVASSPAKDSDDTLANRRAARRAAARAVSGQENTAG